MAGKGLIFCYKRVTMLGVYNREYGTGRFLRRRPCREVLPNVYKKYIARYLKMANHPKEWDAKLRGLKPETVMTARLPVFRSPLFQDY